MSRKESREVAMKLLYQLDIQKEDRNEQIEEILEENEMKSSDKSYVLDVINGVNAHEGEIDNIINACAKGWKIGRISKVDLAILRLAIYELKYRKDIPLNVSINEAVELAKKYSGEEAGPFVNGVLGKVTDEIEIEKEK